MIYKMVTCGECGDSVRLEDAVWLALKGEGDREAYLYCKDCAEAYCEGGDYEEVKP